MSNVEHRMSNVKICGTHFGVLIETRLLCGSLQLKGENRKSGEYDQSSEGVHGVPVGGIVVVRRKDKIIW